MGVIDGSELSQWEMTQKSRRDGSIVVDNGRGANGEKEEKIAVSVRLRPLNAKEIMNKDPCQWECINETTVAFRNTQPERSMLPVAYSFDRVFDRDSTTRQVYEETARNIALSVVSGINSSIFAYGQTSSGKTYTMSAITEYSVADIYDYVEKHQGRAFVLKFSALEIYNEAVGDLLSTDNTPLRLLDDPERGTIVEKLTEEILRDCDHIKELLSICEAQRQIGETSLNEASSRSHQILRLTIESSAREFSSKDKLSTLSASVNFVDLAGSERASQAMSAGTRLKEGCHINRSLLTLGTVIRKLSKGRNGHIPYRDSKLTRILQSSLGGNARTAIICTMSPARSHIEQSRNTLLFASCAKEVVNSARVNIVMSDKELVKHLQKELARLENELRYTTSPSSNFSNADVLLKEKDNQIRKMGKEMKEVMQQRDLAQSQIEDLLQSVGVNHTSTDWAICQTPKTHGTDSCEDEISISEASSVSHHVFDFHTTKIGSTVDSANDSDNYSKKEIQNIMSSGSQIVSPNLPINNTSLVGSFQHHVGEVKLANLGEVEDLCKVVQCIEMDETSVSKHDAPVVESDSLPHLLEDGDNQRGQKLVQNFKEDQYSNSEFSEVKEDKYPNKHDPEMTIDPEVTVFTLEEQLQNTQKSVGNVVEPCFGESSPLPSSGISVLSRSRSCKPSLIHTSSSLWLLDKEQSDSTPPSSLLNDFSRRPTEGFLRSVRALNYWDEGKAPSSEVSQCSESRVSTDVHEEKMVKNTAKDLTSLCDFVIGMKEMGQIECQKHNDDQVHEDEKKNGVNPQIEGFVRDAGVDPMLSPSKSPSRWPFEFEKQREEIIVLWDECNVSLIHRTYFFLLFEGDPADSIYLEVEQRRLSFLKRMFEHRGSYEPILIDGCMVTPASSKKALCREREMLPRGMKKRLSPKEREAIYCEWGIGLDSKQRRLQLARLLWTETRDALHIRASASIVAKLVAFSESGHQAPKEMFGLSFMPQRSSRRSFGWKS